MVRRGRDKTLRRLSEPLKMRRGNERLLSKIKKPNNVQTRLEDISGISALRCVPPKVNDPQKVIYYLHGGGYVVGSCKAYTSLMAKIALESKTEVIGIDYRLAPEFPFPSGLLDAASGYDHLLQSGYSPSDIVIMGDSAGGGLTLSLLTYLKNKDKVMPAAVVLLSPWADLRNNSSSHKTYAENDCIVHPDVLRTFTTYYLGDQTEANSPLVSSVLADLGEFPPMYIQVGSEEVLLDDALALEKKAEQDGAEVHLDILPRFPHVFHFGWAYIPESRKAIQGIARYVHSVFTK